MTCKCCKENPVEYYGGLCERCVKPYKMGEQAERNRLKKEVSQRLEEIIRFLDKMI